MIKLEKEKPFVAGDYIAFDGLIITSLTEDVIKISINDVQVEFLHDKAETKVYRFPIYLETGGKISYDFGNSLVWLIN